MSVSTGLWILLFLFCLGAGLWDGRQIRKRNGVKPKQPMEKPTVAAPPPPPGP